MVTIAINRGFIQLSRLARGEAREIFDILIEIGIEPEQGAISGHSPGQPIINSTR